jgi:hypothetical protein
MATTATIDSNDGAGVMGNKRWIRGTFTTALGDSTITINAPTLGGIYNITDYRVEMTGSVGGQAPKFSISSGVITGTVDGTGDAGDATTGSSGTFFVLGN